MAKNSGVGKGGLKGVYRSFHFRWLPEKLEYHKDLFFKFLNQKVYFNINQQYTFLF